MSKSAPQPRSAIPPLPTPALSEVRPSVKAYPFCREESRAPIEGASIPNRPGFSQSRLGLIIATVVICLALAFIGHMSMSSQLGLLPEIQRFLQEQKEFGRALSVQNVPDWAKGKRQRVYLNSGRNLLFYIKNGDVTSVYEDHPGEGRVKVWGEFETYESPSPLARDSRDNLPAYVVRFATERIGGGGKFGDIVMPSLSRKTPASEREAIARHLAIMEHLADLSLYATEDAYQANISASFSESHPNALRRGFLGSLQNGKFMPGEALFP